MAGLRVNPFAIFAPQAAQGVNAAGAAQPVAKANPFAAYSRESLAEVSGNPYAPSHAGGSTLRGFNGPMEACGSNFCCNA